MKFRKWGERVGEAVLDGVGRVASRVQERKPLPADLLESDETFVAVFDAPGAELEDVQVRFDEGTVRVRIDRYRELYEGFEMRFPGRGLTLDGEIDLPEDTSVKPKESDATLSTNGTLRVEIPKDEDASVDIETHEEGEELPGESPTDVTSGEGVPEAEPLDGEPLESDEPEPEPLDEEPPESDEPPSDRDSLDDEDDGGPGRP